MKGALLLVDASNVTYRASAAHANLTSPSGAFTGGLYGILAMLCTAISRIGAVHVVWCMDTGPYLRALQYPEYKTIRKGNKDPALEERVKETRAGTRALLAAARIPVWELPGYEADDLLALGTLQNRNRYTRIVAMTNDSDAGALYEFENFHVLSAASADKTASPYKSLSDLVGVPMERTEATKLVRMLALSGTHNEVEGLKGIGPVKAHKIASDPKAWAEYYREHAAMIDRNMALIELPHPNLRRQLWEYPAPSRLGKFDARVLYRWAAPHAINITPWMLDALEQVNR